MKILQTEPDFASVISLIQNAREYVIIVSPFNDLAGSDSIKNAINKASRKIRIEYYVREGQGSKGIENLDVNIFEVPKLHAKAFISEHEAMISSGNLDVRPDINCTLLLDKKEEYNSIADFFRKFIKPVAVQLPRI
jgi:phosphatidylserine/phosphatidylglycerophosphate/cardiolipin synthase-like enzyme